MRFIVDEMLGKLARWLRMSGFDVLYQRQIADNELLQLAGQDSRVILTRDTKMIRHLTPDQFLFIHHDYLYEQTSEFYTRFPELKKKQNPLSRCVECNTPIVPIEKEMVKDKVWPYVYQTQEQFTYCSTCQKVYWEATHVKMIRQRLDLLIQTAK